MSDFEETIISKVTIKFKDTIFEETFDRDLGNDDILSATAIDDCFIVQVGHERYFYPLRRLKSAKVIEIPEPEE
jgi:hypothetical protein